MRIGKAEPREPPGIAAELRSDVPPALYVPGLDQIIPTVPRPNAK
jgi:hypothetical protein